MVKFIIIRQVKMTNMNMKDQQKGVEMLEKVVKIKKLENNFLS